MYTALVGGCSVIGLRWWAGVSYACVHLVVSDSSSRAVPVAFVDVAIRWGKSWLSRCMAGLVPLLQGLGYHVVIYPASLQSTGVQRIGSQEQVIYPAVHIESAVAQPDNWHWHTRQGTAATERCKAILSS